MLYHSLALPGQVEFICFSNSTFEISVINVLDMITHNQNKWFTTIVICMRNYDKDLPLVSIITPCYNGEKYIGRYFDSVMAQTYPKIELIFVDDGSRDKSLEIAKSYIKKFEDIKMSLRIIESADNRGAAAAINLGLQVYGGKYLMWSDCDDVLLPDNIREKVIYLENNPDIDYVLCWCESVNEGDLDTTLHVWKRSVSGIDCNGSMIEDLIHGTNVVYGAGVILVRRSSFEKAIPNNSIYESRQGQNFQLLFPLSYCCKCGHIDKVLMKYIIHKDSHSHKKKTYREIIQRQEDFIILIDETLSKIPNITKTDYTKYMECTYQQFYGNELKIAFRFGHLIDYWSIRNKMKSLNIQNERN